MPDDPDPKIGGFSSGTPLSSFDTERAALETAKAKKLTHSLASALADLGKSKFVWEDVDKSKFESFFEVSRSQATEEIRRALSITRALQAEKHVAELQEALQVATLNSKQNKEALAGLERINWD